MSGLGRDEWNRLEWILDKLVTVERTVPVSGK